MNIDYNGTTEFNFEEWIRQGRESGLFNNELHPPMIPPQTPHPQAWTMQAPLFDLAEGWTLYLWMVVFSVFLGSIIFYPFSNIVITLITKRNFRDVLATIGPAVMGAGWIIGISPTPYWSMRVTLIGLLMSSACVLYAVIRRQMDETCIDYTRTDAADMDEVYRRVPESIWTPLKPLLIIGLGILLWDLQLWWHGQ